jgi:hypothetical protein
MRFFYLLSTSFFLILFVFDSCKNKNQIKSEKELLGQYLFFDTNISLNNTKSCAQPLHFPMATGLVLRL